MAKLSLETLVKNFKLDLNQFPEFDGKLPLFDKSQDTTDLELGATVDFETTDLKMGDVEPTEIGAVKFYYHKDTYEFMGVVDTLNQLNEPSSPDKMTETIQKVTGMTFDDVKGHKFDENAIREFFSDCSFVYAHNAQFDRPFFEAIVGEKKWGCSRNDIDWGGQGFVTEQQELLAIQVGFRYSAHRASTDCLANLKILLDSNNFSSFVREVFIPKGTIILDGYPDPFGETTMKDMIKSRDNDFGVTFGWNRDNKNWVSKTIVKASDSKDIISKITDKYNELYGNNPKFKIPTLTFVEKK